MGVHLQTLGSQGVESGVQAPWWGMPAGLLIPQTLWALAVKGLTAPPNPLKLSSARSVSSSPAAPSQRQTDITWGINSLCFSYSRTPQGLRLVPDSSGDCLLAKLLLWLLFPSFSSQSSPPINPFHECPHLQLCSLESHPKIPCHSFAPRLPS